MGSRIIRAMRTAGADPVLAVASDQGHGGRLSEALAVPAIADRWPDEGPLGGLVTALLWFRHGSVLTLPCDLPLVTGEALGPLVAAAVKDPTVGVVAGTASGPNCTIGIWPAQCGAELKKRFDAGARRLDTVLEVVPTVEIRLDQQRLEDADTQDELRRLVGTDMPDTSG